jgi:hypothetical protein
MQEAPPHTHNPIDLQVSGFLASGCIGCVCHDTSAATTMPTTRATALTAASENLQRIDSEEVANNTVWEALPAGSLAPAPGSVLVMTVATHREPFIGLLEKSARDIGANLVIAGEGGFFKGYGWKLKQVRDELIKQRGKFEMVLFTDSYDSYIFAELDEIVEKFRQFEAPMVVSGEVNLWPNPHLRPFVPVQPGAQYVTVPLLRI